MVIFGLVGSQTLLSFDMVGGYELRMSKTKNTLVPLQLIYS